MAGVRNTRVCLDAAVFKTVREFFMMVPQLDELKGQASAAAQNAAIKP
jgi:hypothetical protein